jgi:signal transduction histidine kinase
LINVAKHAEAQHVAVTIKSRADSVILHVSDDGCGFEPDRVMDTTSGERLGLTTMHERARSVGGYLKVESEPNKGSQVTLTVPVMRTVD